MKVLECVFINFVVFEHVKALDTLGKVRQVFQISIVYKSFVLPHKRWGEKLDGATHFPTYNSN